MTEKLFSVISPVYNVARYLPEYFDSLETQSIGMDALEIILVDDGSTDDSLNLCRAFAEKYPESVRVLHKPNGGQSSARNLGLPAATSTWVCFPDPDDVLDANFFSEIRRYMEAPESSHTDFFGGHILVWNETRGTVTDTHPSSFRFEIGDSTTNLDGKPNFMHGNAVISFFRVSVISEAQLSFDERLRTRFEDGKFICEYLLRVNNPVLGLVAGAHYHYRKRTDGTSTMQAAHTDARTYTDVPNYGYLPVLRQAVQQLGKVPKWLQTWVINDIIWLFKADLPGRIPTRSLSADVLNSFHSQIAEVMSLIEPETLLGFDMTSAPLWLKEALAFAYRPEPFVSAVYVGPPDRSRNLIQIRYRFTGDQPDEVVHVRGIRVTPHYEKTQLLIGLGRVLLKERQLWVSSLGVLRVTLGGRLQALNPGEATSSQYKLRRQQIIDAQNLYYEEIPRQFRQVRGRLSNHFRKGVKKWLKRQKQGLQKESIYDAILAGSLRLPWIRRAYSGAWALMDREFEANDSAEQLYRWVRQNKPETKLWFVLNRRSADWDRLKGDGFKLVAYGSYQWKILMLLASHVVSSHADVHITNPLPASRYGRPQWKFSFLQHGIIKGDLSPWLNKKAISFFATSTEDEYRYVSGESPFRFGPKEVRLTGLPRHDVLLEKSEKMPADAVDQLLIAPTWRQYLAGEVVQASRRSMNRDFMKSDFAKSWQQLISSTELKAIASEKNLRIVFLPHPNLQPYLDDFSVPDWVTVKHYEGSDVQDIVCRSAAMITDYSSIAFNMAYLQRPVIYFQFDQERYAAEHIEGAGYYEYESDGFGPVCVDQTTVIESIRSLLEDNAIQGKYRERARRTFPVRDGGNSKRVYDAILETSAALSFEQASVPARLDRLAGHSGKNRP